MEERRRGVGEVPGGTAVDGRHALRCPAALAARLCDARERLEVAEVLAGQRVARPPTPLGLVLVQANLMMVEFLVLRMPAPFAVGFGASSPVPGEYNNSETTPPTRYSFIAFLTRCPRKVA